MSSVQQSYTLEQLQRKIYDILIPILDPEHTNILDEDSINNYWLKAFTHESVDPENNYQLLEFYGDKAMNHAFSEYVRQLAKSQNYNLNQEKATLVLNHYMSTDYQAQMAQSMGLIDFVRYDPGVPDLGIKIQEDIAESFFGALNNVINDKIQHGLGYIYVFNLIQNLFENVTINFDEIKKDSKTQLKELYEKMGWGNAPRYKNEMSDNLSLGRSKVVITSPEGDVIGTGYGNDQKKAEFKAAQEALNTLANRGITAESAEAQKLERIRVQNPDFAQQYNRVEAAIEKINSESVRKNKVQISSFKISPIEHRKFQGKDRYTIAIDASYSRGDGTLAWVKIDSLVGNDKKQTTIDLMRQFADKNKIPE